MVTNYYNASNNYSSPVRRQEPRPYEKACDEIEKVQQKHLNPKKETDNDKILLLGLLAILYLTDCEDMWLILAVLYLAVA